MRVVTFVAALAAAAPACAATLIPVPDVPGSIVTYVNGINDQNVIVGAYRDSGGTYHAFFGSLDGQYTTFDLPGHTGTQARDIDNAGNVVGFAEDAQTKSGYVEFERFADGSIKTISRHRSDLNGIAGGISPRGTFTAENWNDDLTISGFLGRNAKVKTQIDLGFATRKLRPRATTDAGDVAGYFQGTGGGSYHGFLLHGGTADVIDFPDQNAVNGTLLEGLNSKGMVTGYWEDANFDYSAFTYDSRDASFRSITVPGFPNASPNAINGAGLFAIVGYSADFTASASYIYCPKKPSKCPGHGVEIADPKPVYAQPARR
ncbi:MAG: hypothetical protein JOZ72_13305 [Alphaproteobacteria bacterium]|nr:hypothetical protein [Alphaproteobacteria bacterium]